jgi:predicted nucleotidyltransferase
MNRCGNKNESAMFQITENDIQALTQDIVRRFNPERVILFGSRAYGIPREDSDIDLLVVMKFEGRPFRKALEILSAIDFRKPLDLLVKTPDEIEKRYKMGDTVVSEALDNGQVLYARPAS